MPDRALPQLSVLVVAHAEGRLLHACVTAWDRASAVATEAGLTVERLLVLSAPDVATVDWVREIAPAGWQVLSSPSDDVAAARNLGVQRSRGRNIAVMDGGDLPCADWLVRAQAADDEAGVAVWHPELAIQFGAAVAEGRVLFHPDAVAFGYDYAALFDANPYAGGVFARRSVFETVPYPEADAARGFALPDWHWACAIVAAGIDHRIVVESWHYVRLHGSRGATARALAERRRPGPSSMFEGPGRALVDRPFRG
jgi:hypothetical protein